MLQAILMMLYAYSEEPDSWLGQILTPFFEGLMEWVAGDYLETTTLADLLQQSPDSKMGFIERQVYNRFENKLADLLGIEDESQLDALLRQGDVMNEALIAAGVNTSITVKEMREMTPEQLREQIFTPEVMMKLAQNEQFAPLIANVVAGNPDVLTSIIPAAYQEILTDHNKELLQEVMAGIDPTRYAEFAEVFNSLASGNVNLQAMAQMAQHEDLVAALKKLSAEGTGLQIPEGFTVKGIDISAKSEQAFAFLRAEGNIEALQEVAPILAEHPELLEKLSSAIGNPEADALAIVQEYVMENQEERGIILLPLLGLYQKLDISMFEEASLEASREVDHASLGRFSLPDLPFFGKANPEPAMAPA